jgi:predicted neuraminidase
LQQGNMSYPVLSDPSQPDVHASTLLLVEDKLLCAWFGGTKEGHSDTKIWLSIGVVAESQTCWSEPHPVAVEDGLAHWNPVLLFVPATQTILLFYKVGSPISSWYTNIIESKDGGNTWSEPRELVPGDRGVYSHSSCSLTRSTILTRSC